MTRPNFLVIGAQKAGTTWLSMMIRQHPDIFVPVEKEVHFFDVKSNYARGLDWYESHFSAHVGEHAVGECTPYLWGNVPPNLDEEMCARGEPPLAFVEHPYLNRKIPQLVARHYPDMKLIAVLRDPVDRAISAFHHNIRMRRISPRSNILDVGVRHGIIGMGFYFTAICEWLEYFPREHLAVFIYEEDTKKNGRQMLRQVFRHLGVDDSFAPSNMESLYNVRHSDPYIFSRYYLPRLSKKVFQRIPALHRLPMPRIRVTPEDRIRLYRIYQNEIRRLEVLLDRPLSAWMHH